MGHTGRVPGLLGVSFQVYSISSAAETILSYNHTSLSLKLSSLQTALDYSYTAQFLAWMGYSVVEKAGLASALKG